jgi:hypothetical protein
MVRHRQEFASLIKERREFTPQAFHFIPWDYLILNSERFSEFLTRLFRAYHTDQGFQQAIANDLSNRGTTEANIRFVLEELVVRKA